LLGKYVIPTKLNISFGIQKIFGLSEIHTLYQNTFVVRKYLIDVEYIRFLYVEIKHKM